MLTALVCTLWATPQAPKVDPKDLALAADFVYRAEGRKLDKPTTKITRNLMLHVEEGETRCTVDTVTHRVALWSTMKLATHANKPAPIDKARSLKIGIDWMKKMRVPIDGTPEVSASQSGVSITFSKVVNGYPIPGRAQILLNDRGQVWWYSRLGMDDATNKPKIQIKPAQAEKLVRAFVLSKFRKPPKSVKALGLQYSSGPRGSSLQLARKLRLVHYLNYSIGGELGRAEVDVENGQVYDHGIFDSDRS